MKKIWSLPLPKKDPSGCLRARRQEPYKLYLKYVTQKGQKRPKTIFPYWLVVQVSRDLKNIYILLGKEMEESRVG